MPEIIKVYGHKEVTLRNRCSTPYFLLALYTYIASADVAAAFIALA